ncbi:MAG: hypothetical protein MJZ34_16390 [Paludibacteraceae bacterium]|nr:hypothetical protein [Paludibacteraceae bacterium]
MNCEEKTCEWWVDDSVFDIGNYTHEYAIESDSGFCLLKDFFEKCNGKCKDYKEYINDKNT